MRTLKLGTIGIATFLILVPGAWAAETADAAAKSPENQPHTAVYKVVDLSSDLSKQMVKGLSEIEGILSAKQDIESGTFSVTFAPAETDTKAIQTVLESVSNEVTLAGVAPADAKQAHGDCSKCPKQKSCAKQKG